MDASLQLKTKDQSFISRLGFLYVVASRWFDCKDDDKQRHFYWAFSLMKSQQIELFKTDAQSNYLFWLSTEYYTWSTWWSILEVLRFFVIWLERWLQCTFESLFLYWQIDCPAEFHYFLQLLSVCMAHDLDAVLFLPIKMLVLLIYMMFCCSAMLLKVYGCALGMLSDSHHLFVFAS